MAEATPSIVHLNAPTHLPIKLTSLNFLVWRKQLQSTLIGHNLLHHLDDSRIVPAPLQSDKDNAPNPEYLWYRQDQILLSAILGSCSETIQPLISSANTAREAWDRLTLSYANSSRSRIISLKSKLAQNSQGTKSIAEFLTEMRSIADELALAQHPMAEDDLIVHILTQLGNEYSPLVAAIKVRDSPISYSELFDKLTDFERTLHDKESAAQPALATVHATQKHFTRPHPANISFADTPSAHPHYHHRRTKGGRGYSTSQSAYKCLNPTSNRIYLSRHVQFVEHTFPLTAQLDNTNSYPPQQVAAPLPLVPPCVTTTAHAPPPTTLCSDTNTQSRTHDITSPAPHPCPPTLTLDHTHDTSTTPPENNNRISLPPPPHSPDPTPSLATQPLPIEVTNTPLRHTTR
ncbi:hypothetical protein L6164_005707 [Bauhinia variegata]|uniref:Uncharacterized protein n=1 Tax=Bauhinia variegata TaxID=167791 RepID=A0ACB9PU80_BAUVA|nr:hypothetical protein L6164_005707 [Bauhinia variegata]